MKAIFTLLALAAVARADDLSLYEEDAADPRLFFVNFTMFYIKYCIIVW